MPEAQAPAAWPLDRASVAHIRAAVRALPLWTADEKMVGAETAVEATELVLHSLSERTGVTWQQRWHDAAGEHGRGWLDAVPPSDGQVTEAHGRTVRLGTTCLMFVRVLRPDYVFLREFAAHRLYIRTRKAVCPHLFDRVDRNAEALGARDYQRARATGILACLVLHTGRDLDQLVLDDFLDIRAGLTPVGKNAAPGIGLAWDLVRGIARIPDEPLRRFLLPGQRSTEEIVDRYGLHCKPIRDVIVRYLNERRPVIDYSSFQNLAQTLARFWAEIERIQPGIDTLHLPDDVAEAWRQRVAVVDGANGVRRERLSQLGILVPVRAFYLDMAQWALTDPSWAEFAVPCPVRRGDTVGYTKSYKESSARMHQRVRERLPHLLTLADHANAHRVALAELLQASLTRRAGDTFTHNDIAFRVVPRGKNLKGPLRRTSDPAIIVEVVNTGELRDLTREEDEAFWAWAIIETLRHTGIRSEELLEITHLALVTHRIPDTGEVVPLLQIVPSKSNQERLLLVNPELASALAIVISRLRRDNDGTVPLVARFDPHERVWSAPLPFLFQRALDHRRRVIGPGNVNTLLREAWARAGINDTTGKPIHATAHDFRRMFVTEAISGGLPIHIAAKLLGHASITTTQAYHAVFDDELIRAYRAYLAVRRNYRPAEEYREPTDAEWQEFQQHFQNRKLELGDCGRPYGSPCSHEHACIRCPMLRVDPRARGRLVEIIANLRDRIDEARHNGWRGEVQGLQTSLDAAAAKLVSVDRSGRAVAVNDPVSLGMPMTEGSAERHLVRR